jgi:peptidoglycan/LPS O-acetylase OafA/YrhL
MCLSRRAVLRVGVCVIVAACIWRAWLAAEVATAGRLYYSCDTRVDGIMWGCVAACLLADRAWFGRVGAWMSSPVVAVAALVSLVLVAVGMENTEAARYVVVPVAACVLMMSVLMRSLDCRSSVLNALWIGWIGVVSYGIYLFHQPLIGVARRICGQETSAQVMLTCILAATLSVCVASVLYVCFERPFLRLKKRFAT